MELYVLNPEITIIGIISCYDAIVWEECFDEPGTFQATFAYTEKLNSILTRGNLIYKTDELQPGIISYKLLKMNSKGETVIRIKGSMASAYLKRRIIWSRMTMSGTSEDVMRQMVAEQVISPNESDRKIPHIALGEKCGFIDNIEKQASYTNLQETLTDIAQAVGLGYRLRLDISDKMFYFEVFSGTDRTLGTTAPCIFTRSFGNIYTQEYCENDMNYKNVCLIGGKGDGDERILATEGKESGLDRYEMFYNASGLSNENLTDKEYMSQLGQKGAEKLANYALVQSFESKINQRKAMEYALGDWVTCYDSEWNIYMNVQIKEIEKNLSKDENETVLTFGKPQQTISKLIKTALD